MPGPYDRVVAVNDEHDLPEPVQERVAAQLVKPEAPMGRAVVALRSQISTLGKSVYQAPDNSVLADDIPTVTTIVRNFWEPSTIPGTAGWWREKRLGAAEPAPGAWPSSTADPDLDGSTYFRYPGTVHAVASQTSPGDLITGDFKPGGGSVYSRWNLNPSFVTESPTIDIRAFTSVAGGMFGRIMVDGKPISPRAYRNTSVQAGVGIVVRLEFATARERTISIIGMSTAGAFGGVAVEAGYTVRRPFAPRRKIAIIGDSWTDGAGTGAEAVDATETYTFEAALRMGADSIMLASIGGTGFVRTIGGAAESNFDGRIDDVLAWRPDAVLIAGGRNDYGQAPQVRGAVAALLNRLEDVPEVYVMPTGSESDAPAVRTAIALGAEDADRLYIDVPIDSVEKISDNAHPTWAGHQRLADLVFHTISPIDVVTRDELDAALGGLIVPLPNSAPIPEGTRPSAIIVRY